MSVPEPELIPVPVATTDETVGAVVSMTSVPLGLFVNVASALPAVSVSVPPLALSAVTVRSDVLSVAPTV